MSVRKLSLLFSMSALALMTACSSSPPRNEAVFDSAPDSRNAVMFGNVSQIEIVPVAARRSGGGAILGAVIGGVLGNQIGGGTGRAAATAVGVVGGAVVGDKIEQRNKTESEIYRVSVRLDNGQAIQFDYQRIDNLQVGDRVKVQDGQLHRA